MSWVFSHSLRTLGSGSNFRVFLPTSPSPPPDHLLLSLMQKRFLISSSCYAAVFLFLPSHPCRLFGLTARPHHSLKVSRHTLLVPTTLPTFFMRRTSMARTATWPASQSLESSPPKVFFNFTSHLVLVTPRNHISFRTQTLNSAFDPHFTLVFPGAVNLLFHEHSKILSSLF